MLWLKIVVVALVSVTLAVWFAAMGLYLWLEYKDWRKKERTWTMKN